MPLQCLSCFFVVVQALQKQLADLKEDLEQQKKTSEEQSSSSVQLKELQDQYVNIPLTPVEHGLFQKTHQQLWIFQACSEGAGNPPAAGGVGGKDEGVV